MNNTQTLNEKHNLLNETIFRIKTLFLIIIRLVKNTIKPLKKFKKSYIEDDNLIIAFSESELWNPFDTRDNWILTAGKIENLRIAIKKLNGLKVSKNEIFSFWKHIGNPNFGKGYVVGREIREGCIVPTTAGGLCQLSNALYDAALKANFEIVERHKHTKIIKGSLAEQDRDATVKWNYVDLQFKSSYDFTLSVEMNSDKLIVAFRTNNLNANIKSISVDTTKLFQPSKLNDCYSCGNITCFKHPKKSTKKIDTAITTYILDEKWDEYDSYIKNKSADSDYFILPLKANKIFKTTRYSWSIKNYNNIRYTQSKGIIRALKLRFASKNKNLFELNLTLDKEIAKKAAKMIPIESTHIVVSQNLLPFIYETGALGGRTFEVLMTRLPIENLHQRLDEAFKKYSFSKTLKDFRAPYQIINNENKALTKAQKIITPHNEIAELFINKSEKIEWLIPEKESPTNNQNKILFPASALGRKGAYEIKQLLKELKFDLLISGNKFEEENFWENLNVEKFNGNFNNIGLILYPTYIENQPRILLQALSRGIPIITTTASGLESSDLVTVIDVGDYNSFKAAVENHFKIAK